MKDRIIKQSVVFGGSSNNLYEIGNTYVEIKDESLEYQDSIITIYCLYSSEGKLLRRLENCSCDITFA